MKITLKACRINAKMSRSDAAQAVGVSEVTLSRWENGSSSPDMEQGLRLSLVYKMPLEYINFSRVANSSF